MEGRGTNAPHDAHLDARAKRATERSSENMHILVNDPSLALYRIQEHIRKALPPTVERRGEVVHMHRQLQGRCYDAEYAISAVKGMQKAEPIFSNIQELLRNSLFLRQQLIYEEKRNRERTEPSMYKRLSSHISLDLTDLPDLGDAWRETASRVESVFAHARSSMADREDKSEHRRSTAN
ncbi:BLOC-1-related complex subunit 8 homolog [Pollicipes pollicipes]|uniref:BLOC-1-related complex subunit 8 homolog n=1 Tax=Pollicipes pollicipes TaxID=41117 RepID=UPI0018850F54|nr:BLOC-1-related complex subunit 8 homolog [Pollicipes pollicipes]XP_037081504.1 BLOC-1-related complex subunit 8 homolog [Pollicipes pollicipes]